MIETAFLGYLVRNTYYGISYCCRSLEVMSASSSSQPLGVLQGLQGFKQQQQLLTSYYLCPSDY